MLSPYEAIYTLPRGMRNMQEKLYQPISLDIYVTVTPVAGTAQGHTEKKC